MNSTNHTNEKKMKDAKASCHSTNMNNTYPKNILATDPNLALQNAVNQNGGNMEAFDADTVAGVSAGIIVVGTMLGAFAAPVTAGVIISFGTLAPILWPNGPEDKTVWKQFMKMGENVYNNALTDVEIERALTYLISFKKSIDSYEAALKSWQEKKQNQAPANELKLAAQIAKGRLELAHHDFLINMPHLRLASFKTEMLPTYAQAANLHLNTLRQATEFADQWNADIVSSKKIPYAETNPGTSEGYYELLQEHINQYSDHCIETYKLGLKTLEDATDITWNIYNQYRREMTLAVLDLVALFPNYDIRNYPMGTQSELTREIYTDAFINGNNNTNPPLEQLEKVLTRKEDLFTRIKSLDFFTRNFGDYFQDNFGLTANRINYSYTGSDELKMSDIYGSYANTDTQKSLNLSGNSIYKASITHHKDYNTVITKMNFALTNQQTLTYDTGNKANSNYLRTRDLSFPNNDGSAPTFNNYSHILSYIKSYVNYQQNSVFRFVGFGWTHSSVNPLNIILSDTITQIPAVKARAIGGNSKVIEGPGFTGGNVVDLKDSLELAFQHANSQQSYYVRLRYASTKDVNNGICLTIPGVTTRQCVDLNQTVDMTDYSKLQNKDFDYIIFPATIELKLSSVPYELQLEIEDGIGGVLIDKIEFVPYNP
ncbi:insecticidal delta-endotoxin Cry8Ea1 family protein [Peribacillus muralis]|uniref:insecticidal delta-endotoxin Cry8Ea1 family protein n=1 Tax=Peribacillus muralis TaxID=264697 RepID=UPI003D089BBE